MPNTLHEPDAADAGLTGAAAAERLARVGPNTLPEPARPSIALRALRQLVEPLVLILFAAGLVSIFVLRESKEGGAILFIVALNVLAGAWQEHRADQAVAALADLTAPHARVRRDRAVVSLPAAQIVPGDVVELEAGDRVPADVRLVVAKSLAVDESMLTGESIAVEKSVGDDAFAGTLVVRGRAVAEVHATGARTELGGLAASLSAPPPPPLQHNLRVVGQLIAVVAIGLGGVLMVVAALRAEPGEGLAEAMLAGVALAVAAIPEGLPAAVTLALAVGAQRMARHGAIVRLLSAIETLGSTTVLCIDKTGTLTEGTLRVAGIDAVAGRDRALWAALLRCNDAPTGGTDPVDVAILLAAGEAGVEPPVGERLAEEPFDSATRLMATVHASADGPVLSVKGAPEAVLARCAPGADTVALAEDAGRAAAAGERVLVAADLATEHLDAVGLRPLGLVRLADPLRASAAPAVAECRRAGIRVVVVTGDHRDTAVAIARQAGLDTEPVVTQAELDAMSLDERTHALSAAAVVARVQPGVKVELVEAHRRGGGVIAMTGDGVNDAPALRRADIGVAIGGDGGTDVAREASDMVVTNGDLGTIVTAVREGRRIYRNLRSVVSYLVAGNLSEIAVMLIGVVLIPELAVPLLPVQLLWVNLITDGLPALALGADRPPGDVMDTAPRQSGDRLLDGRRLARLSLRAAVVAAAVLASGLYARRTGWSPEVQRTQLVLTLVLGHLVLAYASRTERLTFGRGWSANRALLGAVAGSIVLQAAVVGIAPLRSLLDLAPLPWAGWAVATAAVAACVGVLDALRFAASRRAATAGRNAPEGD